APRPPQRSTTGGRAGTVRGLNWRERRGALACDPFEHLGGCVEVRMHRVDIVEFFERVYQVHERARMFFIDGDERRWAVAELGALDLDAGRLERCDDGRELGLLADDLEDVLVGRDVLGAGV